MASKSKPPHRPPISEITPSRTAHLPWRITSRRYAHALARLAGQSATELLAFAVIGGMPAASIAGKEKNVPPPAMAFMPPAKKAPPPTSNASARSIESHLECKEIFNAESSKVLHVNAELYR